MKRLRGLDRKILRSVTRSSISGFRKSSASTWIYIIYNYFISDWSEASWRDQNGRGRRKLAHPSSHGVGSRMADTEAIPYRRVQSPQHYC